MTVDLVLAAQSDSVPQVFVYLVGLVGVVMSIVGLVTALNFNGVSSRIAKRNQTRRDKGDRHGITSTGVIRAIGVFSALIVGGSCLVIFLATLAG